MMRQIRAGLVATHRKLRKWQARSVWIVALAHGKNPDPAQLRTDAEALMNEVREEQIVVKKLETELVGASGNSIIGDTLAALAGIEAAMLGLLRSLPS